METSFEQSVVFWVPRVAGVAFVVVYVISLAVVSFFLPSWKRFRYLLLAFVLLVAVPQLSRHLFEGYTPWGLGALALIVCWEENHPVQSSLRIASAAILGYLAYTLVAFHMP